MVEIKRVYEALVKKKVKELGEIVEDPIIQGVEGVCPNCGHFGYYDLEGLGLSASSIFYSAATGGWRCRMCEFDLCSI
jgi:hypothetical protein